MSPRRRRPLLAVATIVALAVVAVAAAVAVLRDGRPAERDAGVRGAAATDPEGSAAQRAGATGDSTCTDPAGGREWRVSWRTAASPMGVVLTPTAFASRPTGDGTWTDEGAGTWELRWSLVPSPSPEFGTLLPEKTLRGTLPLLTAARTPVRFSPRFVSPDGSCTVFAAPYGTGDAGARRVAIIGDSLVGQLGPDADMNAPPLVATPLLERGQRVEVNGQGGRRWTDQPDAAPGLERANFVMTDEIRGLRGAEVQVIALGTNDAGWVTLAKDQQEYELRLAWVLLHLDPLLDELAASGQCTVLVTAEDRKVSYIGRDEAQFTRAAGEVNDLLRKRAAEDPDDNLRLQDWAATSAGHHTGDPEPWYLADTVHLNAAGRHRYAQELATAAGLCP
jgi:lysophospholipase L1-like esterase